MRQMMVNVVAFAFMGWLLFSLGTTVATWKFWAALAAMVCVQINDSFPD